VGNPAETIFRRDEYVAVSEALNALFGESSEFAGKDDTVDAESQKRQADPKPYGDTSENGIEEEYRGEHNCRDKGQNHPDDTTLEIARHEAGLAERIDRDNDNPYTDGENESDIDDCGGKGEKPASDYDFDDAERKAPTPVGGSTCIGESVTDVEHTVEHHKGGKGVGHDRYGGYRTDEAPNAECDTYDPGYQRYPPVSGKAGLKVK